MQRDEILQDLIDRAKTIIGQHGGPEKFLEVYPSFDSWISEEEKKKGRNWRKKPRTKQEMQERRAKEENVGRSIRFRHAVAGLLGLY